jgi:hypothetical protein
MSYSMSNDSDKDMAVSRWLSTIIDYPCHPPDPAASCVSENNMATTSIMPAKTASLSKGHSGPEEWDTCMHIHDLAQLSGCFCNMNSILDLVKHNLDDLCVIKVSRPSSPLKVASINKLTLCRMSQPDYLHGTPNSPASKYWPG